jgi:hypothetical protein
LIERKKKIPKFVKLIFRTSYLPVRAAQRRWRLLQPNTSSLITGGRNARGGQGGRLFMGKKKKPRFTLVDVNDELNLENWNESQRLLLQQAHLQPKDAVVLIRKSIDEQPDIAAVLILSVKDGHRTTHGLLRHEHEDDALTQILFEQDLADGFLPIAFVVAYDDGREVVHLFPWMEIRCVVKHMDRISLLQQATETFNRIDRGELTELPREPLSNGWIN